MIARLAAILTSIVSIWTYLVKRRRQAWQLFVQWKKRRRENAVEKAVDRGDGGMLTNIVRAIKKKRKKRRDSS